MSRTAAVLFLLVVPSVALVTKQATGTAPLEHPADATTIEGVDCNHVSTIIGKWTKSTKVGNLLGAAKATMDAATQAAANGDAAADAAEAVGLKVGLDGVAPPSVADAVGVARAASTDASAKALTLQGTFDAAKTSMAASSFAADVSNADITQITTETQNVVVATSDLNKAVTRATEKAAEAKEAALKNTKGALKMIKGVLLDIASLTKKIHAMEQRIGFSTKDVNASVAKSESSPFMVQLMTYINNHAGEQAPVWQARHDDIVSRASQLSTDSGAVNGKLATMMGALGNMTAEETTLKGVVDAAQSSESAALGQAQNIAKAEETIRTATTAYDSCNKDVITMMVSKKRLDDKYADVQKRLKTAPHGPSR